MKDNITIKKFPNGITLHLNPEIPFEKLLEELAQKFNIMSIPTIMIFKNGMVVKTFVGLTDKNEIIKEIN